MGGERSQSLSQPMRASLHVYQNLPTCYLSVLEKKSTCERVKHPYVGKKRLVQYLLSVCKIPVIYSLSNWIYDLCSLQVLFIFCKGSVFFPCRCFVSENLSKFAT